MFNPFDTIRRFQSRLGKPIRPIVEIQKGGSVINIITNTIQTENMIQDQYRNEAWEVHPEDRASAIVIDGIYKGMGFIAGEEGQILQIKKDVELYNEVLDHEGNPVMINVIDKEGKPTGEQVPRLTRVMLASYKGQMSKLLDASIIERGSALKPSMMQTLIYCALIGFAAFMAGMSYA